MPAVDRGRWHPQHQQGFTGSERGVAQRKTARLSAVRLNVPRSFLHYCWSAPRACRRRHHPPTRLLTNPVLEATACKVSTSSWLRGLLAMLASCAHSFCYNERVNGKKRVWPTSTEQLRCCNCCGQGVCKQVSSLLLCLLIH